MIEKEILPALEAWAAQSEKPDAARALAADMLGTVPDMLRRYKATIRDGYAQPFGAALHLERERARAFNAGVAASAVEARREAVRERNRGG